MLRRTNMRTPLIFVSIAIVLSVISIPTAFANQLTVPSSVNTTSSATLPQPQPNTLRNQNAINGSHTQNATVQAQMRTPTTLHRRCTGDAAKAKPPVPNNSTHLRNVIWRNMRAMCT